MVYNNVITIKLITIKLIMFCYKNIIVIKTIMCSVQLKRIMKTLAFKLTYCTKYSGVVYSM